MTVDPEKLKALAEIRARHELWYAIPASVRKRGKSQVAEDRATLLDITAALIQRLAEEEQLRAMWETNYDAQRQRNVELSAKVAEAEAKVAVLVEAAAEAHHHIDMALGDTDPQDDDHPLLLAAQALAPFAGDNSELHGGIDNDRP